MECEYFDPVDMLCMAGPEVKAAATANIDRMEMDDDEVDPATFLFDDDDEEDDFSDLPPERDADEDDFNPADDDDDW